MVPGKATIATRSREMVSLRNGVLYGHCDENVGVIVANLWLYFGQDYVLEERNGSWKAPTSDCETG